MQINVSDLMHNLNVNSTQIITFWRGWQILCCLLVRELIGKNINAIRLGAGGKREAFQLSTIIGLLQKGQHTLLEKFIYWLFNNSAFWQWFFSLLLYCIRMQHTQFTRWAQCLYRILKGSLWALHSTSSAVGHLKHRPAWASPHLPIQPSLLPQYMLIW